MTTAAAPRPARPSASSEEGYFHAHRGDLAHRLREAVPREELKRLHARSGARHALVALKQAALYGACWWALITFDQPWIWLPVAALQGFVILCFIILLHDVVHDCAFARRRATASRWLGRLYALPSAISASQFHRWHLDHHKELGSADKDPKRAYLSPKRNSRLLKLAYMTPALFLIYARAAAHALAGYPAGLQRTIRMERLANMALHVALLAGLVQAFGWEVALRAHVLPLFVFFPIAFTVNRLGQHYWVDATDPAKWGTRVDGNPLIGFLFLNSHLHLEHHYFPGVPLYRLPALNRAMRPFWEAIGHPSRNYRQLLWGWFVENREAHSDWEDGSRR
jgi:fatty acid desaturase